MQLGAMLMTILKYGVWGAGALLLLFGAISVWQTRQPDGSFLMTRQDWTFLGVLVALFALAVYLFRSITKEIEHPGQ